MNKRVLVILGVFILGFAAGYGLTWIVVSGPGPSTDAAATVGTAPGVTVAAADATSAPPLAPVAPATADPATASAAVAPDAQVASADVTAASAEVAPEEAAPEEAAPEEAAPEEAAPEEAAPEAAKDLPWWDACLDETCRVDFGQLRGGVSIRRGTVVHKEDVDWNARFGDAPKVGVLPVKRGVTVELHGVGMVHGVPAAAQITWRGDGEPVTGVIALSIGDKHITLRPPTP